MPKCQVKKLEKGKRKYRALMEEREIERPSRRYDDDGSVKTFSVDNGEENTTKFWGRRDGTKTVIMMCG